MTKVGSRELVKKLISRDVQTEKYAGFNSSSSSEKVLHKISCLRYQQCRFISLENSIDGEVWLKAKQIFCIQIVEARQQLEKLAMFGQFLRLLFNFETSSTRGEIVGPFQLRFCWLLPTGPPHLNELFSTQESCPLPQNCFG